MRIGCFFPHWNAMSHKSSVNEPEEALWPHCAIHWNVHLTPKRGQEKQVNSGLLILLYPSTVHVCSKASGVIKNHQHCCESLCCWDEKPRLQESTGLSGPSLYSNGLWGLRRWRTTSTRLYAIFTDPNIQHAQIEGNVLMFII